MASATQGSSNPIYISRLHVRNYRSIVDAEFTFDPQCNILIGQNNSGKSNIMRALNVALGRDGDRISVDDYNDPKEDVLIKVTVKGLSQTSNVMKSLSETYQDAKYTLEEQEFTLGLLYPTVAKRLEDKAKREATSKRLTTTPHDDQPGELTDTEPYRMNPRYGAVYKLLPTVLPERRNKYDINGNLDFFATTNAPHLASSLRADLTLVYIEGLRDYDSELHKDNSTVQRLLTKIILSDQKTYRSTNTRRDRGNTSFGEAVGSDEFKDLQREISDLIGTNIGVNLSNLNFRFRDFNLMDLIRRYYLAVGGDRSLPVQHEGFGTLNFIVIALIQVLLLQPDAAGIVVLIEEPEIGLHPQAQRLLFRKLAEVYKHTGNQLIISTHSPNVALMWHQSDFRHKITRLVKRSIQEGTQVIPTPNIETSGGEATAPNTLKKIVRQHMMTLGGDVFFADKVVIVEGATELGALPLLAQRLDYDFEANNISVVMAGGANSMPTLASMCRDLNIPCLVLYDLDIFVRDGSLARKLNTKSDEYMKLKAALAKLGSPKEKASEDEIDKATTALTNLGWNPTKDDVSDFLSKFKTRDKLSGLVPTAEEMTAINDILFTANAWALPMDFEEAFLEHYPPSDYDDIRTLIKNIYDKTDCEQYRDQLNSDESNKKYKKCMAELLKRTCKNEYFWRIFLSGTLPNGSGWIHPELVRFIKKLKEL